MISKTMMTKESNMLTIRHCQDSYLH